MTDDTDQDAGLRAYLGTDDGLAVLDAVDTAIRRACRQDGAARADDVMAAGGGHPDTQRAAEASLVEIGAVREVNPPGTHRVLVAA